MNKCYISTFCIYLQLVCPKTTKLMTKNLLLASLLLLNTYSVFAQKSADESTKLIAGPMLVLYRRLPCSNVDACF